VSKYTTKMPPFSLCRKRKRELPSLSIDLLECVLVHGMSSHVMNTHVIMMLLTNKELYMRMMNNHNFWVQKYILWTVGYGKFKAVPNAQLLSSPVLFQPSDLKVLCSQPEVHGILKPAQVGFNDMTRRILALRAQNTCCMCFNSARRTHSFWYLKKRFCELCLPQVFLSDNVLAFEYGIRIDGKVLCRNGEMVPFIDACKGHVYYYYNQYSKAQRVIYTTNYLDLRLKNDAHIVYFAKEQLEKVLDLYELKRIFKEKQDAALRLTAYLNPIRLNILIQGNVITEQWLKGTKHQKRRENRALKRVYELRVKHTNILVQRAQKLATRPFPVLTYSCHFQLKLKAHRMYVQEDYIKRCLC